MSSSHKTLEEMMNQLPADSQSKVYSFAEYQLKKKIALSDPEFLADLEAACKHTFDHYRQSYYESWQDLRLAVLLRFYQWLPKYRGRAKRRTVLEKIATNVLIDAERRASSSFRFLEELDFDELTQEAKPIKSANNTHTINPQSNKSSKESVKKLNQVWAGALSAYRERYSSLELQKKALEWRGD